jgi:dipeptidyl aminopeptidase/acylaminoacyl peptidase
MTKALRLALLLATLPLHAQTAATILDSMPHAKKIDQVAISPDGTKVAYIVNGELAITPTTTPIALPNKLPLREVTWSQDSKTIAFLADLPSEIPSAQIWTASADGKALTKHAELKGYVQSPRLSPDATTLSVLFIEGLPRAAGPLQPMTPLAGVINQEFFEQRISTIDLATDRFTQVTPKDVYIYEYDWTPDSKSWAAISAHGSGDSNWWIATLSVVDAKTGEMREIYKPKLQLANPIVSPDGKTVAFIEGLMSDAGLTGGEIHTVPTMGGAAQNLTPKSKTSPSAIAWASPTQITFAQNKDGNSSFATINTTGGPAKEIYTGEELDGTTSDAWVPSASFSRDASITAIARQSGSAPPEVWAGPTGDWKQLTTINQGIQSKWGETRNFHWMNRTIHVEGWLTLPKHYDPSKTYPLVVTVHGGPSWACTSHWDEEIAGPISAMDYFVLCPNPRGSYGQGEAFTQGNVKDFGGGDYQDIMTGIDTVSKQFPINPRQIGIRGHSYGGYMAMWAETQTNRFAAVVAGAGLSDWLSYYGVNDIDEWMTPFFGATIYDDPAVYNKSDPMHYVKAVKTPTLILVGDRDGEVPMEQSVEWWHALVAQHVPTKLVVYPNEGHLFVRPADTRDYDLRTMEWFEEWFENAK